MKTLNYNYPAEIVTDGTLTERPEEPVEILRPAPSTDKTDAQVAMLHADLDYLKHKLAMIDDIPYKHVSYEEYEPIRKLVYGMVTMVIVAIVGTLISFVIST